uniref:Uncharacterized protein n=1 Tax=Anopheles maculatus TaxID=74869 RepID=A0A182T7L7_9DIPT
MNNPTDTSSRIMMMMLLLMMTMAVGSFFHFCFQPTTVLTDKEAANDPVPFVGGKQRTQLRTGGIPKSTRYGTRCRIKRTIHVDKTEIISFGKSSCVFVSCHVPKLKVGSSLQGLQEQWKNGR